MAVERYVPKRIAELDASSDRRVCLAGTVTAAKSDGNFIIDDGNGSIEIVNDSRPGFVKEGAKVRVFAANFEGKLKADIIQDLGNVDLNLFNKAGELYRKAGLA